MTRKKLACAALAGAAIALATFAGAAQARSNVYWSVGVNSPGFNVGVAPAAPYYGYGQPVYVAPPPPVYVQPRGVYYAPQPVYMAPRPVYYEPPAYYGPPRPAFYGGRGGGGYRGQPHGHGGGWHGR